MTEINDLPSTNARITIAVGRDSEAITLSLKEDTGTITCQLTTDQAMHLSQMLMLEISMFEMEKY